MNELTTLLKQLRGNQSLREASTKIGISHNYLANLEKGMDPRSKAPINPSIDTLKKIAVAYNYPYEQLLQVAGYIDENTLKITKDNGKLKKEERDIAKRMEQMKKDLEHSDGLAFMGEPLSSEAKESLLTALEFIVRQTKDINKKYIPKKFRE